MKVIIISDIHGNLEALNKVLEYIDKLEGETRVVCLGDIVGYGPNPAECFKIIESLTDKICLGNHEDSILDINYDYHNTMAKIEKSNLPLFLAKRLAKGV